MFVIVGYDILLRLKQRYLFMAIICSFNGFEDQTRLMFHFPWPTGCLPELQRRSSKILPGQCPLSKRVLSRDARFIALPYIMDSLASASPQGNQMSYVCQCVNVCWSVMTIDLALTYIRHLVSIGPDNAPSVLDS